MPIVLNNTNKSLVVELTESPTNQPDYVCTYMDRGVSGPYEGSSDGTLTDATTTTIVPAPSASDMTRTIRYISVHNTEVANPITLTFKLSNDTNKRVIRKVNLQAGSTIVYHDDQWTTYNYSEATSDGWIAADEVWAYASADSPTFTFTISGDKSGKYQAGQRLKLTQTTVKYFIVTAVAYSAPDTTITCYGGTDYTLANATITNPYYSREKAPFGFPLGSTKWSVVTSDTADRTIAGAVTGTVYNPNSTAIILPIGVWDVTLSCNIRGNSSAVCYALFAGLSTTQNSFTDFSLVNRIYASSSSGVLYFHATLNWRGATITTKTTYYVNCAGYDSGASLTSLVVTGAATTTIVKAICAYL